MNVVEKIDCYEECNDQLCMQERSDRDDLIGFWHILSNDWICLIQSLPRCVIVSSQVELPFIEKQKTKFELKYEQFELVKAKFKELYPMLLERYRNKYVAIMMDDIVISDTEDELLDEVIEKHGSQPMYITKITEDEKVYRIRSPRLRI